jgi:hypothetical protein
MKMKIKVMLSAVTMLSINCQAMMQEDGLRAGGGIDVVPRCTYETMIKVANVFYRNAQKLGENLATLQSFVQLMQDNPDLNCGQLIDLCVARGDIDPEAFMRAMEQKIPDFCTPARASATDESQRTAPESQDQARHVPADTEVQPATRRRGRLSSLLEQADHPSPLAGALLNASLGDWIQLV